MTGDPIPALTKLEPKRWSGKTTTGLSVLLDVRPLQGPSAIRGVGSYATGLLGGLIAAGFDSNLTLLLDADLAEPALPAGAYRLALFLRAAAWSARLAFSFEAS